MFVVVVVGGASRRCCVVGVPAAAALVGAVVESIFIVESAESNPSTSDEGSAIKSRNKSSALLTRSLLLSCSCDDRDDLIPVVI